MTTPEAVQRLGDGVLQDLKHHVHGAGGCMYESTYRQAVIEYIALLARTPAPAPPDAATVARVLVRARRDLDAWEIGQGPSPFTRETLKQIDQTLAALRAARGAP